MVGLNKKRRGEELDQAITTKKQKLGPDDHGLLCLNVLESLREDWFGLMDFVTIKSKLAKNLYGNIAEEFPKDVRLIFDNAIRYYPPRDSLHKHAKKLKRMFEVRWDYWPEPEEIKEEEEI